MFLNRLFVSTIFALGLASAVIAQNAAPATAPTAEHIQLGREVVEASGAAKTFDQVIPVFIEQAKSSILGSNPDLSKDLTTVGEAIKPDFQKRTSELMNNLGAAYAQNFSMDELKKMRDFYRSPEGKKMVEFLPKVMEASYVQTQEWSQVMSRDIMLRFKAEFAKRNIKI